MGSVLQGVTTRRASATGDVHPLVDPPVPTGTSIGGEMEIPSIQSTPAPLSSRRMNVILVGS
jgi:hypothetical protein